MSSLSGVNGSTVFTVRRAAPATIALAERHPGATQRSGDSRQASSVLPGLAERHQMSDIAARIDAWERAGLIDPATATRLRAAEATEAGAATDELAATRPIVAPEPTHPRLLGIGSAFGPTASIAEMFAYLGAAFLIAAYSTFVSRVAEGSRDRDAVFTGGAALLTVVVVVIGAWLAGRDERSRRGGGVLFLVAVGGAAITANFLTQLLGWTWGAGPELFVAVVAVGVAIVLRSFLPALATHLGLLGAITLAGAAVLDVARRAIGGRLTDSVGGGYDPDSVPRVASLAEDVLLPLAGWLIVALVIGLIGLREGRRREPSAEVRASLSRFWAGMVAISGTWSSVSASGYLGPKDYGRILEPWIGDAIVGVVVAVLVERAIRRDTAAYIIPAAIGLIAALTDLNFRYLTDSTELGLLLEGAILLGVGFAADRVRRRLGHARPAAPPPLPPEMPAVS
jgi:MFS family permease